MCGKVRLSPPWKARPQLVRAPSLLLTKPTSTSPVSIHLPLPWLHLELHHPNLQPIPLLQQDPVHHDAVTTLPLYQRPPGGPFQLCLCGILYKGYFALDMQGHYEVSCPPGTLADTSDEAPSSILTNYLPLPGTRWHSLKEEAHSLCIPCMLHSLIL